MITKDDVKLFLRWLKENDYFREFNSCSYKQFSYNHRFKYYNCFEYINNCCTTRAVSNYNFRNIIANAFSWTIAKVNFCRISDEFRLFLFNNEIGNNCQFKKFNHLNFKK